MKHETFKEWILLSALGELGDDEERSLEAHLGGCPSCRAEMEETRSFVALIGNARTAGPSEEALGEARRSLREALAEEARLAERAARSAAERSIESGALPGYASPSPSGDSRLPAGLRGGWMGFFSPARVALAGTAAVAVGFLAGYFVFGKMAPRTLSPGPIEVTRQETELGTSAYRNVRLANVDPRTNEVEIEYEMVRPARIKGPIDDVRVRSVLARAVLQEGNAGTRLQAINTIGTYVTRPEDVEIKRALIRAAKTDPNPGVRKQALYVLYQMPFDADIKEACLYTLANDKNEGLRIAAINILAVAMLEGHVEGKEVIDAVGSRLQKDENEYIRIQSGAFLQEVNGSVE